MRYLLLCLLLLSLGAVKAQLWQPIGGSASGPVRCLYADTAAGLLYVGGDFGTIGGLPAYQVATWDGANWDTLGPGTGDLGCAAGCNGIRSLVPFQGNVFASGSHYMMAGIVGQGRLNRWDGTRWDTCGNPNGPVFLDYSQGRGGDLYALWGFSEISGSPANNVARWDGQRWMPFATGMPDSGYSGFTTCVEEYQGSLYVGGNFECNGFNEIARWDGGQWQSLNDGILGDSWVNTMTVYKDLLFVGGYFSHNSGNAASCIAVWDGTQWLNPFPNVFFGGQVTDLQVIGGYLYIVGYFMVHDGGGWQGYYAVARYDGNEFCAFGGTNFFADRIAGLGGRLYIATEQEINGVVVNYFARWRGGDSTDICISQPVRVQDPVWTQNPTPSLYPNPTNSSFSLNLPPNTASCTLKIHDITGREVAPARTYRAGDPPVDVTHLSAGLYFVEVQVKDWVEVVKLVKE